MQQQVHLQHQQAAQNQHQSQQVHQQLEDVEPIANLQPKKMISAAAKKYYCDENLIQVEQPLIVSQVKDPLPPPSAPSEATEPAASNRREKRVKVKANQNLANTERMSQHEVVVAVQRLTRRTRHTANGNTTRVSELLALKFHRYFPQYIDFFLCWCVCGEIGKGSIDRITGSTI